jgi:hypothetical protein
MTIVIALYIVVAHGSRFLLERCENDILLDHFPPNSAQVQQIRGIFNVPASTAPPRLLEIDHRPTEYYQVLFNNSVGWA